MIKSTVSSLLKESGNCFKCILIVVRGQKQNSHYLLCHKRLGTYELEEPRFVSQEAFVTKYESCVVLKHYEH